MANRIKDIRGRKFSPSDKLLIDANVWLKLYGPQGDPKNPTVVIYSSAQESILKAKATVHIDVLVLSEFINRYARLIFEELIAYGLLDAKTNYKQFRDDKRFLPLAKEIASTVRRLSANCKQVDSSFKDLDLKSLVASFEKGGQDFNDLMLAEICRKNGLTLITHDGDFKTSDIDILTCNQELLKL